MVSSIERFHCIQDSQLGPNGVLYREVPLYTGQSAGPNGVLYREVPLYVLQIVYTYVCITASPLTDKIFRWEEWSQVDKQSHQKQAEEERLKPGKLKEKDTTYVLSAHTAEQIICECTWGMHIDICIHTYVHII